MSAGPVFLSDNVHLGNYVQYVKQHSTHNCHCRTASNRKTRVVKSDCFDKTWNIAFSDDSLLRQDTLNHIRITAQWPRLRSTRNWKSHSFIIIIIIIIIIEFFTSQLWLGTIHLPWDVVINRIRLGGLTCSLKSFLRDWTCAKNYRFLQLYIYVFGCKLSLIRLCDSDFGITPVDDITIGITYTTFCLLLLLLLLLLISG